ncbi:MAG: hypothetical protein ACRDVP_01645 [Acidimicrobiales bacterium]
MREIRLPDIKALVAVPRSLGERPPRIHAVKGVSPDGEPVTVRTELGWTLLVFLSTDCQGCLPLWSVGRRHSEPPLSQVNAHVVTRISGEDPTAVADSGGDASVVMSDEAWDDYVVHSAPFFVLVDGRSGRLASEGVAWSVEQVCDCVSRALRAESARPNG